MANAKLDQNSRPTLTALDSTGTGVIVPLYADPTTHRLLVDLPTGAGITSINGDTTAAQLITVGTAGTDVAVSNAVAGTTTINIPDASATARGVITTGTQTIAGTKTFSSTITGNISGNAGGSSASCTGNAATATTAPSTAVLVDQTSGQTIGATGTRLTKLWATDITVTNAIAGGVTGNAGTVTNGVYTTGADTVYATPTGALTFTNKRITPRILSAASYTTDTGTSINGDTLDMFIVTAQTGALKFNNPSGTPTDGQKLIISVASSTTAARALTWDTAYGATTVALPTTTAATTATLSIGFIWSASKTLWQCVAVS